MKEIQTLLKRYTEEQLAEKLGVARSTIFRWRDGEEPSRLAKARIKQFFLTEELQIQN